MMEATRILVSTVLPAMLLCCYLASCSGASSDDDGMTESNSSNVETPHPEITYSFSTVDTSTVYTDRSGLDRLVKMRVYYPLDTDMSVIAPLVVISHGGTGNFDSSARFQYLGEALSSKAYVVAVLTHRPSRGGIIDHVFERPSDVSRAIDHLQSFDMPVDFTATADFTNAGHIGHSFGAYTSHAVAGANFVQGQFTDARIKAIVALSPQGPDRFGSFDEELILDLPSSSNSWQSVEVPAFNIVGELEIDSAGEGDFILDNWRLFPFYRYEQRENKYLAILPDASHSDLGSNGPENVQGYISSNTMPFFDRYLRQIKEKEKEIGNQQTYPGVVFETGETQF